MKAHLYITILNEWTDVAKPTIHINTFSFLEIDKCSLDLWNFWK